MTSTILVTGGCGFIGSHLVEALISRGYRVKVIDALVPQVHGQIDGQPRFLAAETIFVRADLCDVDRWTHLLSDVDAVVHLAAEVGVGQSMYEIVRYVRGNALGTATLLEALLEHRDRIGKLVVASSMSVYGEGAYRCPNCGDTYPKVRPSEQLESRDWDVRCSICGETAVAVPTREDKPLQPTSIYAITKRDHEEMCMVFGRAYGIPTVALRFFNVYGPRQALSNPYTGVAAIFSSRLLNGRPPLVFEDGQQSRDFVHVSDVVQALLLAVRCDCCQDEVFNVGTGHPVSVLDLALALAREIGADIEPQLVNQSRAGDIRHCFPDTSRIVGMLGYKPGVGLEEGVKDLVGWLRGEVATDRVDSAFRELALRGLTR